MNLIEKVFAINTPQEWTDIQKLLLSNPNTKWNGSEENYFLELPEPIIPDTIYIILFSNNKICHALNTKTLINFILNNKERCLNTEFIESKKFIRKTKLQKLL